MSQPALNITEQDGGLGVLPPSSGRPYALCGVSSGGTQNLPSSYARVKDVVAAFGAGPLVEAAAYFIDRFSKPVVLVRTGSSVAASYGTLTLAVTGTSVITADATTFPNDDYEVVILFVAGGTRGTAGITYQWSLDGGRTMSPVTALGTGNSIVIPGSGGIKVDLAAGTIVAGDKVSFRANAPQWNSSELGTALDALRNSAVQWEIVHPVGAVDATSFDLIETKLAGMQAAGKYRMWIGNTRTPNSGESEATYAAAMNTAFNTKSTKLGALGAGACKIISGVSGRQYRRAIAFAHAALEAAVSEEVNTADINVGALSGVSIRDVNGNVDEHDESVNPGLDDSRFVTLRTWGDDAQGVFINRPRLFSPDGSDFQLVPHRRVLSLTEAAVRVYFIRRINRPVTVDKKTGFIFEEEALEIEDGALAIMRSVLAPKPKASGWLFSLSRFDNLISTKTMNGLVRVIPLAYPEFINLDFGYYNPTLQLKAV